jgi:hypothetical protein
VSKGTPHSIWFSHLCIARRSGYHHSATQPHLRLDLLNQRRRSGTLVALHDHSTWIAGHRLVEPANQRRQLLLSSREAVDAEWTVKRVVASQRRYDRPIGSLCLNTVARRVRSGEQRLVRRTMVRRRGGPDRNRQSGWMGVSVIRKSMSANGCTQPLTNGSPILSSRRRKNHDDSIVGIAPNDVIVTQDESGDAADLVDDRLHIV